MIGYVRVSYVGGRDEIISPDIQKAEGGRWCPPHGYRIVRWIVDLDETGRNFDRDVMEAIKAVEAGEAAAIGVYNYARWGRNTRDSLNNLKRVSDVGGDVVSWTEPFDSQTAIGVFGRTMAFAVAELQSLQIGEGWERAHGNRVARGLTATGTPRFGYVRLGRVRDEGRRGYRRDPDDPAGERYVPDPVTGPVLAEMYRRDVDGAPRRSIARWLNRERIRTAAGGEWTIAGVRVVLASGFGAGLLRVHDPECRIKPTRERQCNRTIYVSGVHPPVISPELWEAWLERHAERRELPPRLRDPVHPWSGLLWCHGKPHRLSVVIDRGGVAYRCTRKAEGRDCPGVYVREPFVEETVLGWLAQWAADIEAQAEIAQARHRTVARARDDLGQLAQDEARLQRRLARLMTRWANDDHMEETAYNMARAPIEADLARVRERVREAGQAERRNTGAYVPVAVGLLQEWHTLSPASRRHILGALITRIEVHKTGPRQPPRIRIVPVWHDN
jgi:DNA invertase Pin-like site-specific DNA recombinase